jgi:hypothetical protein
MYLKALESEWALPLKITSNLIKQMVASCGSEPTKIKVIEKIIFPKNYISPFVFAGTMDPKTKYFPRSVQFQGIDHIERVKPKDVTRWFETHSSVYRQDNYGTQVLLNSQTLSPEPDKFIRKFDAAIPGVCACRLSAIIESASSGATRISYYYTIRVDAPESQITLMNYQDGSLSQTTTLGDFIRHFSQYMATLIKTRFNPTHMSPDEKASFEKFSLLIHI